MFLNICYHTYMYHISLNSQFTVVLNGIICFSVRFCDNSLLVLKKSFQVFSFASKLTFSKLVRKVNSQKENLKKCTSFEEQKGTRYIRENVYFGVIIFSSLSSTKQCLIFLLNCFVREIKGF